MTILVEKEKKKTGKGKLSVCNKHCEICNPIKKISIAVGDSYGNGRRRKEAGRQVLGEFSFDLDPDM